MQKIKKIICYLLIIVLFTGYNTINTSAQAANIPGSSQLENAIDDLQTYNLKDLFAGRREDDGRVETDKSVFYRRDDFNAFNNYEEDEFAIVLSALGQTYNNINEDGHIVKKTHPDVIFVIDASGSMRQYTVSGNVLMTRAQATAEGLNSAIKELYAEDPETRIGIVTFGFGLEDGVYLPLDKYTLPEGQTDYITWNGMMVASQQSANDISGIVSKVTPVVSGTVRITTYFYPINKTIGTSNTTSRLRYQINASGRVRRYNANSTSYTTLSSVLASGSYVEDTANGYVIYRNGNNYYVYTKADFDDYKSSLVASSNMAYDVKTQASSGTVATIKTIPKWPGYQQSNNVWGYYKPSVGEMSKIATTSSGKTYYAAINGNYVFLFDNECPMALAFMTYDNESTTYSKTFVTDEITIELTSTSSLKYTTYTYEKKTSTTLSFESHEYVMATNFLIDSKGETVKPSSHHFVTGVGTYTQSGLQAAENMFRETGNKENRVPALVLLSDGIPTVSDTNVNNPQLMMKVGTTVGYGLSTSSGEVNSQFLCNHGLRTIETAMKVKSNIDNMYANSNNRKALFYTIGPGVDYIFGQTILNPTNENIEAAAAKTTNAGENTESGVGVPSDLARTISSKYQDLTYVDYADWSFTGDMSANELIDAFKKIVTSIIDINRPIKAEHLSESTENILSDVVFTDNIGSGFEILNSPIIRYGEVNYVYTDVRYKDNSTFYKYDYQVKEESSQKTFSLKDVTVEVIKVNDEYIVKWYIPSELVPLIIFNELEEKYIYSDPIRLIYKVGLTDDSKETSNWYYTNKVDNPASVTFTPSEDNLYYRANENVNFSGENRDKKFNETDTLYYTNNSLITNSDKIQVLLGNNGKIFVNFTKTEIIPDVIVVDYDKTIECFPLENDIEAERLIGIGAIDGETYSKEIKTQSGVFKIQDSCVLFTPFKYMSEINRVKYYVEAFDINGNKYILFSTIKVIPATTVYYEDNFGGSEEDGGLYIKYTGNWQQIDDNGNKYDVLDANTNPLNRQDRGEVGQGKTPYGYDSHYNNCSQFSNGTATTVQGTVSKDENGKAVFDAFAEFEFTGTGFDIISRTDIDCGMISVVIYDADNKFIDNVPVINKGVDNLYQIPVISYTGIPYNTYKVRINVSAPQRFLNISGSTFYLDAIRIYNPMGLSDSDNAEFSEANEAYYIDKEANENIISIRDVIINDGTSSIENTSGILYVDTKDNSYTSGTKLTKDDIPTFELIGPNEEVYLSPGEGIGFAMRANSIPESVQISAKMPNQNINGEIMINNRSIKINSATEMFYDFTKDINFEKKDGYYEAKILIYNHVKNDEINNIVSLTNIKSTFNEKNTDVIETASLLDNQIELFANEEVFENLCAAIDVKPTSLTMISAPQKVNYNYNEKIDTSGLVMELVYSDGQKQKIYSGYELSSYKANHIGNKTITVKYMNFEVGFRIKTEISLKDIILILFGLGWLVK